MKPHILSQGEQIPQTFLWLSVNSSLGYEEKEEDKQRGVSPPSRKAGDRRGEERQLWRCYRGGGGVGRLQVSSTTSHCPRGRRHPPSPHQNLISTLTHIHWSSTFNKTVPGRELLTWGKTRSGFHHLPISSITARAIPSPDGPKQQSLNFLAPQTRGQFFHGPEGGGRVVWRWFKCITSIIISVPLQTIRH